MDLGYYVLYLHHGFGNKRIVRLERTINEYLERAQTENEMKTETLAELLKVRYGIDVQKEINLIPMQQLIRIYQRNNPLTINDTRQLLNDTAYSYMTLACTALKLMFKLSVYGGRYMITQIGFLRKGDVFRFEGDIYKVGHLLESTNGYVSCININTGKKKRLHIDVDVEIEQAN